jgi:hypothetical protein
MSEVETHIEASQVGDEPTGESSVHGKREWQPWSTGAKVIVFFGIIAALSLVAVFVNLALPVH